MHFRYDVTSGRGSEVLSGRKDCICTSGLRNKTYKRTETYFWCDVSSGRKKEIFEADVTDFLIQPLFINLMVYNKGAKHPGYNNLPRSLDIYFRLHGGKFYAQELALRVWRLSLRSSRLWSVILVSINDQSVQRDEVHLTSLAAIIFLPFFK